MSVITFYGKPGCQTNRKQKTLLRMAGFQLELVDLLDYPWKAEELALFFGPRPVSEWFNPATPLVRDGHIDPQSLHEDEALSMLVAEPLLIRRPLLEYQGRRLAGFDLQHVEQLLGVVLLNADGEAPEAVDECSRPQAAKGCP